MAGLPGYPRNFSRDTLLAGIITRDGELLQSQLAMSRLHQGIKFDVINGEEPGKIHHEYPGVAVRSPQLTTYNACDTTALYLIGLEQLYLLDQKVDGAVIAQYQQSVESALGYIQNHCKDDIFCEFPPAGADRFSLKVTYWKDSVLASSGTKNEPEYPVAYGLVQFQVARAVLAAAHMLQRDDLRVQAERMFKTGIQLFVRHDSFCIAQDASGRLEQTSSDELHALAYIPKSYASLLPLEAIQARAAQLITPAGVACTPLEVSDHMEDTYHGYVVWALEQALIHYGCQKFGLNELVDITKRCVEYIDEGNELLDVVPTISPRGNPHQLWSVAAKVYFSDAPSLRQTRWL